MAKSGHSAGVDSFDGIFINFFVSSCNWEFFDYLYSKQFTIAQQLYTYNQITRLFSSVTELRLIFYPAGA